MGMHPMDRRSFLTRAGLGAGALMISNPMPGQGLRNPDGKRKLGVALVGLGNYSTGQLAPALQATRDCYLAGVVSGTHDKRRQWKEQFALKDENVLSYVKYDQLRDRPDIDIVYVVLPNFMHAEYTIRAAEAGKHVICEKPMGMNAAECRRMIDACKANGVRLSVGYRLHFDPYHQTMMGIARQKPLGKIKLSLSEFGFVIGNPDQWRLKKELAGGGAVMDIGVYCIQAARYSTQEEPVAIRAQEFKSDPVKFAEVDETVTWQLEFPSGAVSNSTTSYNGRFNRLYVSYEQGVGEVAPAYGYGGQRGQVNGRPMDFPKVNQQAEHMDAMARAVRDGGPTPVPGEEGLRDMIVVDALYQSLAFGGRRVPISMEGV